MSTQKAEHFYFVSFILGFGSTRHELVQAKLVHYDCGCLINETGELVHFPSAKGNGSPLTVPSVYVVYMATFGAMVSLE